MSKMIKKLFNIELKGVDKENKSLEAIFSSQKEDRHGDVVMQDGWELKNFKTNPVILNSHNHDDATEVIGKVEKGTLKIENGKLFGKIKFAVDENPKAKIIFDLYAGGYLNAFSVGFIANEYDPKDFSKILKAELLEVSAVSVPANAYALAKSKGIDVDKLKEYDKSNNKDNDEDKKVKKTDAKVDNDNSKEGREKDKANKHKEDGGISKDASNEKEIKELKADLGELKSLLEKITNNNKEEKKVEVKEVEKIKASKEERMKEIINKYKNNKISSLAKINGAIGVVGNHYKGRLSSDKSNNNYLVNTAIKELLKLKD